MKSLLTETPISPYNAFFRQCVDNNDGDSASGDKWHNTVADLINPKNRKLYAVKVADVISGELVGCAVFNVHSAYQSVRENVEPSFPTRVGNSQQVCKDKETG